MVTNKCFNQLRMAIVVEKIEKIIKINSETAIVVEKIEKIIKINSETVEIEHFHSKKGIFHMDMSNVFYQMDRYMINNSLRSSSISVLMIFRSDIFLHAILGAEHKRIYFINVLCVICNDDVTTCSLKIRRMILWRCSKPSSDVHPIGISSISWYIGTCFKRIWSPTGIYRLGRRR